MNNLAAIVEAGCPNGLLLDANLLMVYLIGQADLSYLDINTRTSNFTEDHFEWIQLLTHYVAKLLTTPHILTEVSDLLDPSSRTPPDFQKVFRDFICLAEEVADAATTLMHEPLFERFGLADCAAGVLAHRRKCLFVSADAKLVTELQRLGVNAWNINWDFPD
jgi:hypothetical protein